LFKPSLASARSQLRKRTISICTLALGVLAFGAALAGAQVTTFGGNAQHTNLYSATAQTMNKIRWQVSIDNSNSGEFGHYGAPLVTAANTVITSCLTDGLVVQLNAYDGKTGTPKWTITTDYTFPPHGWLPEYQACISGTRLYYQGIGGTVYYVDNIDTDTPSSPTQVCFYGMSTYQADKANFDANVFIDTPLTPDSAGNIYFGFRIPVGQSAPAPFTTISGYAKIDSSGNGTYALVDAMTGDANISRDLHNTAPALSNDESKVYVVAGKSDTRYYGYLVALNTSDLSTNSQVFLKDPRNGNSAGILDDGTASPMVGPDGDVYLGVFANPYNGSRGFLAHFSGDLSESKIWGGFGWDFTPGIVPASMIPSYKGSSSYLLFCKYNNYTGTGLDDGDGVNRVAVIDPNALETDAHSSSNGLQVMREVQTVIGFTPDSENPQLPLAVREMCVNATCVNPSTNSVFFNSEDGRAYRWDLATNQVTESLVLTQGFGEPYVPTVVGPDGTIFTLNGGNLFAMGSEDTGALTLTSSNPDSRTELPTRNFTFTAHLNVFPNAAQGNTGVHGLGIPADVVTFTDVTFDGPNPVITDLGSAPLDGSGNASVTTTLTAAGSIYGNHFITAAFSGDNSNPATSVTLVQKVHQFATTTDLQAVGNPSAFGQPVVLTATVAGVGTTDIPTGQVTFLSDGKPIGQTPLDGTGVSTFTVSNLKGGTHLIQAEYQSDVVFASSSNVSEVQLEIDADSSLALTSSVNPSTFGQSVTFTATASAVNADAGTPTGSVVFTVDGSANPPVAVDENGVATLNTSTLTLGSHTISAAFTGTGGWSNSNATDVTQQVNDGTSTALTSDVNPSTSGQSVTFTATVTAADAGAGTPTGSVTFKDGATVLASDVPLDGTGKATFSTNTLTNGSHSITATFTGTGGWGNSNGGLTQVVNGATGSTKTTLTSNHNPSKVGQSVKFFADVFSTAGGGHPTGAVTFLDGATTLATVTINGGGHATFTTSSLSLGSHTIHANFVGTGGWQNSSATLTQVVKVDSTAPSVPQNIHGYGGPTNGHIALSWSPSTDPDDAVDHYEVWRSKFLFTGFSRIANVTTGTSYDDNPGRFVRRRYYIVAVDTHGNKSKPSAIVTAFGK